MRAKLSAQNVLQLVVNSLLNGTGMKMQYYLIIFVMSLRTKHTNSLFYRLPERILVHTQLELEMKILKYDWMLQVKFCILTLMMLCIVVRFIIVQMCLLNSNMCILNTPMEVGIHQNIYVNENVLLNYNFRIIGICVYVTVNLYNQELCIITEILRNYV